MSLNVQDIAHGLSLRDPEPFLAHQAAQLTLHKPPAGTYLIGYCGLDPFDVSTCKAHEPSAAGLVVSSFCEYFGSVSFPSVLELGLRVMKLGNSSVRYEVGVFAKGEAAAKAVGGYTHVSVHKESHHEPKERAYSMGVGVREGLGKFFSQ